jgi:hypothetical protein
VPLEKFGITVRLILAMFSGVHVQVQVLLPPAHLRNLPFYESQSSEICLSEHGIHQSILGLTPCVSTAINHWQSCFGFLHGASSVICFSAPVFHFWVHRSMGGYRIHSRDNMILSSYSLSFRFYCCHCTMVGKGSGSRIL